MGSESVVKWGIIGCGDVCEMKSGPALYKTPQSRLVAVMRRDKAKAADYAKRHGVEKSYTDAQDLVNDPEVTAVYIATPPGSHLEHTILAARAGKPVLVEKPMARTHAECIEMVGACKAAGVPLFVAYYRRCLPNHVKVKELISDGAIGEPRTVSVQLFHSVSRHNQDAWRADPAVAGGGYFMDLASHQLDFLDYLFGAITDVAGLARNQASLYAAEDVVSSVFSFENGVVGTGLWCFSCDQSSQCDEVTISGSKGRIVFSSFLPAPIVLHAEAGQTRIDVPMPAHVHQPLVQRVVNDLTQNGGDACPSTGTTAARTAWVMDEILKSWRAKKSLPVGG
ncbi:1-5-anhydro-D-fructose reductase [Diplonema papillatum]|nr:1-5-anhydro-D-fructose reductase [Diplonema papillatum]|eukprot:gene3935-6086_t